MDQIKNDKLRSYSVWVPILLTDAERAVPNATKRLPDNRVTHFWDGKGELVEAYKTILPTRNAETGEYGKLGTFISFLHLALNGKINPLRQAFGCINYTPSIRRTRSTARVWQLSYKGYLSSYGLLCD
jgi:hypothetical protein